MKKYAEMNKQELQDEITLLKAQYKKYQEMTKVIADKVSKDTREQISPVELAFIEW